MKQDLNKGPGYFLPRKAATLLSVTIFMIAVAASAFKKNPPAKEIRLNLAERDSIESVKAFETVYKTLMSPRCMNCHPAGDVPLQGDDSHLHAMGPKRGVDGKGVYAMKCANCHQDWVFRRS